MPHPDPLRLQAYFDSELDVMAAAEVEQHLRGCEGCRAQLQTLDALRAGLRDELPPEPLPTALRLRLDELLTDELLTSESGSSSVARPVRATRPSQLAWLSWPFWLGGVSGGALVAAAATAFAVLGWLPRAQPIQDELVSAYVRSMMSAHPIDVASSDHHTVKPWFGGHADVSPVVADFDAQGYRLVGGRADYLEHQRAAVMVYQHNAHTINVFSWAAGAQSRSDLSAERDGYHIVCWRAQDLNYCAVSDTGWDELRTLQGLLQDLSARDKP